MMIVGGPHAFRGRSAMILRFLDDWIQVKILASGEQPDALWVFRVTELLLEQSEMDRMRAAGERAGTLWRDFEAQEQVNGMLRFVRKRQGRHRRAGGEL